MSQTVADTAIAGYSFQRHVVPATEGEHAYRLHLAIPDAPPPPEGYPTVWLLDGNAALMTLEAETLKNLAQRPSPPVLVFVAANNDLRIDSARRSYDYTPLRDGVSEPQFDPVPGRRNGGAAHFLAWLKGPAYHQVHSVAPLDPQHQALWGHSYGGLFALYVLFTEAHSFNSYGAADPSLWWGNGYLLGLEARAATPNAPLPTLHLWIGEPDSAAQTRTAAIADPSRQALLDARRSVPPDATLRMSERLQQRGWDVQLEVLPGLNHGQTLGASLSRYLERVFSAPSTSRISHTHE